MSEYIFREATEAARLTCRDLVWDVARPDQESYPPLMPRVKVRHDARQRALIVSHEASRTGAPRVAICVTRALSGEKWKPVVVLRWGGPLENEFRSLGVKVVREPLRRTRALLRVMRRTRSLASRLEQFAAFIVLLRFRPSVVWCNTVLSGCYIRPALLLGCGVVLHVHEPGERVSQVMHRYRIPNRKLQLIQLVGCAPKVALTLSEVTGQPLDRIACLPSVPDSEVVKALAFGAEPPALPPYRCLIGGCGVPNHTKGVDLWLAIASLVVAAAPDLAPLFVWVGGQSPRDIPTDRPVPESSVLFLEATPNPYVAMAAMNLFVLSSREDPFPLVVLEAMTLGVPVVAFDVGDVAEQLGDAGRVVPALDVEAAAAEIVNLLRAPGERERMARAGQDRTHRLFSIERFNEEVERLAAEALGQLSTRSSGHEGGG